MNYLNKIKLASKIRKLVSGSSMPDMNKIARLTRLSNLSNPKMLMAAAAIIWSTMAGSICGAAASPDSQEVMAAFSTAGVRLQQRIGGVPYMNRKGRIVVSGSVAELDSKLNGCQARTQDIYDIARANEPAITYAMMELADKVDGTLEGLEYSLKTASSIESKIQRKTDKDIRNGLMPKSDYEYVEAAGDLIRYTMIVEHDTMAKATMDVISAMKQAGYSVTEVDNKYLDPDGRYKAIHINAKAPSGQAFELQMHSELTLEANQATHKLYEEWRMPETEQARKDQLFNQIKSIYDALPVPKDIQLVHNLTA